MSQQKSIAILGASNKSDRYSHRLLSILKAKGYQIFPIHPAISEIDGIKAFPNIESLPTKPDILTLYVSEERSTQLAQSIIDSGVSEIIFNPGAENPPLMQKLLARGKNAYEACSIVMSSTGQL